MEEKVKKVYVVGGATNYASWIKNHKLVDDLKDADIVLFTGGEDVDPSLYNCEKHPTTWSNIKRDQEELEIFKKIKHNQLALGICRGSQFLCVANGGILIQDCFGHCLASTHPITDGNRHVEITSTHHQMQYPYLLDRNDYNVLFWASNRLSYYYKGNNIRREPPEEPEVVYYHVNGNPQCLAIQGHPEIMRKESPIINILNDLIDKCLEDVR